MSTKPRPEVGQTVYTRERRRTGPVAVALTVTRIGRKYFYAAPEGAARNAERQFFLADWCENTYMGRGGEAHTADEIAEHQAKEAAQRRLNATGWTLTRFFGALPEPLTADQLNTIAATIEQGSTE